MSSTNGDLWTGTANGVLRPGADSANTLGRRRTKSGPKRVTFKLESDSPPRDVASVAETDTTDGMPSWWPRPAHTAQTTGSPVENSSLVTSRPPPAVVISPPAVSSSTLSSTTSDVLEFSPRAQAVSGSPLPGVYYPNGSALQRVSSPPPTGNGHRDTTSPSSPISVQSPVSPPIGSYDRSRVTSPPPMEAQSRDPLQSVGQDRVTSFASTTTNSFSRLRTPVRSVYQGESASPSRSPSNVTSSAANQNSSSEQTPMPSWWPRQTSDVRPFLTTSADIRPTSSQAQPPSSSSSSPQQVLRRQGSEPEYYDNISSDWQTRNTTSSVSRSGTTTSPPPLPARPWDQRPPASLPPPVPTRPAVSLSPSSPPPNSEHQIARVVSQANQSFLQPARDVATLAPPPLALPPDPDFTHPSEEDFWHLSPRPSGKPAPSPGSDVSGPVSPSAERTVISEATQTVVDPLSAVDETWSRLLDVVTADGHSQQPPGLHSRYRDTLRRRPESEAGDSRGTPSQQGDWQARERLARQRQELEELEQRRRKQQAEEERQRQVQRALEREREEERRRIEEQQFLEKQDEQRRLFEERRLFQQREEERRKQEEQQRMQRQEEERRWQDRERILREQEEERQRQEHQRMLQQKREEEARMQQQRQEEEARIQQQRREEELRIQHQQRLQREEEERRKREHDEHIKRQEEEQRRRKWEEEEHRRRQQQQEQQEKQREEQLRLQREEEQQQRQLELQEQLQRELRNQHQQQWRQEQQEQQERRQRELRQQDEQIRQEQERKQLQQQRLAADWRRSEGSSTPQDSGLRRTVSLRESSRAVDAARRAGRVWDDDGDWVRRRLDDDVGGRDSQERVIVESAAHARMVREERMVTSSAWGETHGSYSTTQNRPDSFPRGTSVERSPSAQSSTRDPPLSRSSPSSDSSDPRRTFDSRDSSRMENGQRRASFQQSFMSPPPGGYASPASPSKSDPGWSHGASAGPDGSTSGRSSPSPLDDELEICLKSVEEAMASLQTTVQKNNANARAPPPTAAPRPELNRSFEVSPMGGAASGDWRRRSCDGAELETFNRGGGRNWSRSDGEDDVSADERHGQAGRSWGVLPPLQDNSCHLWTAAGNTSSNWTRLVIGDWLLGSPDNRNDVLSRQIALWEGQPDSTGPARRQRSIRGPPVRALQETRGYQETRGQHDIRGGYGRREYEEGHQDDQEQDQISRIGMESRQKHRHITERMLPSSSSSSHSGSSIQRYDSWRSSSQTATPMTPTPTTPTPSAWQQSPTSPPPTSPNQWRSGPARQSPTGSTSREWESRNAPRQSPQGTLPWQQQGSPQEPPWSTGQRRANTLTGEMRAGPGFGRRPAQAQYQSQSATLPAGQPRSPAAWGFSDREMPRPGSSQSSSAGPQMAAPSGHWAAPLSPSGSVTSVDWNQLFETSSEQSSCVEEDVVSVSGGGEYRRPLGRDEVLSWYQRHQLPRGAGVDALTGRAAAWFHGLVGRVEAEQRLRPCPPGAYLVRCSQRIWGYTLSYRSQQRCKHFLVEANDDGYRFYGNPERLFRTLDELLRHHTMQPITSQGGELLRFPCANITNTAASQLLM